MRINRLITGENRKKLKATDITEWLFAVHDDVKKRALECFYETAKVAFEGRSKKFEYITSDYARKVLEVDGSMLAECDCGIVLDNGNGTAEMKQKLDMLAQAALQNQTLKFGTIMKIYSSASLAEKQRMIEEDERQTQEQAQQAQQQQLQQQQQIAQMQEQTKLQQIEAQERQHKEDNETKILVAEINSRAEEQRFAIKYGEDDGIEEISADKKAELEEKIREFDKKLELDREKLKIERAKLNKQNKS